MKTLHPASQEQLAKIGAAYLIFSANPDVFGDVTYKQLCSLFVDDIIDDGEDTKEARMKACAEDMYYALSNLRYELQHGGAQDADYIKQVIDEVGELLALIDGKEDASDE